MNTLHVKTGDTAVVLSGKEKGKRGKVSGASAADVSVWEESGDGRGRYEGELFLDGMKYEFELNPRTGRIFDWTADLRD